MNYYIKPQRIIVDTICTYVLCNRKNIDQYTHIYIYIYSGCCLKLSLWCGTKLITLD